ncbi:MAG: DUF697 domain-containing protein [Gammaproteobacteria bacterium]|nr:DUF697 domain-containing protein [Gammaproteobacteria bacterium]
MRDALPSWSSNKPAKTPDTAPPEDSKPLSRARHSLRALLDDPRVPDQVRESLAADFQQVELMLNKLDQGQLHIAVFGRVSVGKSALLNALLGHEEFRTSPLHGETRDARAAAWREVDAGGLYLIDTPGIDEIDGETRERLAHEVAGRADLVLFVCDGDLTQSELAALRRLRAHQRPLLLVLNKADRYTREELVLLEQTLAERVADILPAGHIVTAAAKPGERLYLQIDAEGNEHELRRRPPVDIALLRERLWTIMAGEGQTLAAVNAGLVAGELADQVGARLVEVKREVADKLVRGYCVTKGLLVAINPVPVTDLFAAIAVDVGMIVHLSRLHESPLTRAEAGSLVRTIAMQMALLMGTVWGVHLLSSLLKTTSFGLSTVLTASAQGAVAYYSSYVIGLAANRYFAQGRSWGVGGPKRMVQEILDDLDRDSILAEARSEIAARLRNAV